MGNRMKEGEREEKIVRGLLKLKENRRCINCNSLGPQYVCTNFSTFVCTTCSGVHREFTHRVKSISMSKFTAPDVVALQSGGNQRAREFSLREWDFKRNLLPESSNIDRLRDFIKKVYVERRYITSNVTPRGRFVEGEETRENRGAEPWSRNRVTSQKAAYEDRFAVGRRLEQTDTYECEEEQTRGFKNGIYDNHVCNIPDERGPRLSDVGQDRRERGYYGQQRRGVQDGSGQSLDEGVVAYEDRPRWSVDYCGLPRRYSVDHYVGSRQRLSFSRGNFEGDSPPSFPTKDSNGSNQVISRGGNDLYSNGGKSDGGYQPSPVEPRKDMHMARFASFGNAPPVLCNSAIALKRAQSDSLIDFSQYPTSASKKSSQFDPFRVNLTADTQADSNGWIMFEESPEMGTAKGRGNEHSSMNQVAPANSAKSLVNGTLPAQQFMEQSWNPFSINNPCQFSTQQQSQAPNLQADISTTWRPSPTYMSVQSMGMQSGAQTGVSPLLHQQFLPVEVSSGSMSCAQPQRSTNPFDVHAATDLFPDMNSLQMALPTTTSTIGSLSTQWSNTIRSLPTVVPQSLDAMAGGIGFLAQHFSNSSTSIPAMHLQAATPSLGPVYLGEYPKQAGFTPDMMLTGPRSNQDISQNSPRYGTNPFN